MSVHSVYDGTTFSHHYDYLRVVSHLNGLYYSTTPHGDNQQCSAKTAVTIHISCKHLLLLACTRISGPPLCVSSEIPRSRRKRSKCKASNYNIPCTQRFEWMSFNMMIIIANWRCVKAKTSFDAFALPRFQFAIFIIMLKLIHANYCWMVVWIPT